MELERHLLVGFWHWRECRLVRGKRIGFLVGDGRRDGLDFDDEGDGREEREYSYVRKKQLWTLLVSVWWHNKVGDAPGR